MKIAKIETHVLSIPEDEPLANAPERDNAMRPVIAVTIRTDDGTDGIGLTFYGGALTKALDRAVQDLGALIIGDDPLRTEADRCQAERRRRGLRTRRHLHPGALGARHRAMGYQGQSARPADLEAARRDAKHGARHTHPVRCGAV